MLADGVPDMNASCIDAWIFGERHPLRIPLCMGVSAARIVLEAIRLCAPLGGQERPLLRLG